jgi:hypothetical protein
MYILENVFDLIEEVKKEKKQESADNKKDKSESIDQFHERIKFNKWKKKILKNRAININVGGDKQLFGPHEKHIKIAMDKQTQVERQNQANMEKQQHDMQMAKLAPKPTLKDIPRPASPNLASASKSVTNTHSKMAKDSIPTQKDIIPKKPDNSTEQSKTLKRIITMTKGMNNAIKGYKCGSCSFPVPKYRGKYPTNCVNCEEPLVKVPIKGRTKKKK